ncbi:MAG TPA: radical SAM family heme chaperone HemW [Actinomycetota bacterium]|jgi:oxygen-independent coproporphyrinogen-3 oxidase|nr:radical SAM family heme chaperone HemW [Actinomycetota bacterium]
MTLAIETVPRPRDVLGEFGMYVHVPFCAHRCWYCDFNAYAGLDHLADAYMSALVEDVRRGLSAPEQADLGSRPAITSIFIGGGTPSLVAAEHMTKLLEAIRASWPVAPGAEVTIECNPESIDARKLETYLASGVNRISFGVQSLDDELLTRLGRTHDAHTALAALRAARCAGFDNVSADLIFGVPGEDDNAWRMSVEGVLACDPAHISCYGLTYEEGTPLGAWKRLGKVVPVGDDEVATRWEAAESLLTDAGFHRYEISNWARPGRESRHNDLYWRCGEYMGIGAGAHGHLATTDAAVRSWTLRSPERYVRSIQARLRPVAGHETIDVRTRASEVLVLGLRRTGGVRAGDFADLVGRALEDVFGDELQTAVHRGLVAWDGTVVRLLRPLVADEATVLFA